MTAERQPAATLTLRETAAKIGCSEYQLRVMINRGEAPAYVVVGRDRRFRVATIERWLVAREKQILLVLKRNRQMVEKFARDAPAGSMTCNGRGVK